MKDTTAFRERFNRWKAGEKVYEAGLPTYKDGRDVTNQQIIDHAWAVENPTRRGLNPDGTWSQYPDPAGGGLMNVGAGSLVDNEAARKAGRIGVVPDKKFYTTKEVNEPWIKNYQEGWPNIAKSYDEKYGTRAYPHPSDTINPQTRLLAVSTRGKTGKLKQTKWPAFYQAIADGDIAKQLIESRTKFGENEDQFDNDRIRREAEALWPGRFSVTWDEKNPKKKAIVTPKFQDGKESEIYGGTLPEILVTPKGVGHNYEVTDNREMIPTGAQYSDAERHETEGKLGGNYVRKNLHEAAPVVFDLLSSVEPIANPLATASAIKSLYNVVRHPSTITRNVIRGLKNPPDVKKIDSGIYKSDKEIYNAILKGDDVSDYSHIPESHKGTQYEQLPDWLKDEFRNTVYPRMKEQRPWISDDALRQEFEQALSGGYKSVPQITMDKAIGKPGYKGVYMPDVDKLAVVDKEVEYVLPHEVRHKIDNHIPLTEEETDILQRAYNEFFDNLNLDVNAGMDSERVTTNRDARENLLNLVGGSYKDYKRQNELIDASSSDDIIDAVKYANGYGKAYISKLEELDRLNEGTVSRNQIVQLIKNAMKRVGILTGSTYIPTKTLQNPANSKKK